MIEIIPFEEKYSADFKRLNLEWLEKYFVVEPYDDYQLSHPIEEIIEKNGYIFLAREGNRIIGTAAMMKGNDNSFELTKMSVSKDKQGKGVSKLLMDTCLLMAKEQNCERLFLYSNTILGPAINLYRKYGFEEIPLEDGSQYSRTNIKMQLIIF